VLRAGTAVNVVPVQAVIEGTLRTFSPGQRLDALGRLGELCARVGAAEGVTIELELLERTPAVVNDPDVTDLVRRLAAARLGAGHVVTLPPVGPSDDVAEMLALLGGCYFFVGGARADGSGGMHHSPTFALDEESLRVGATVLTDAAMALAAGGATT
jgi:amidohydrolase